MAGSDLALPLKYSCDQNRIVEKAPPLPRLQCTVVGMLSCVQVQKPTPVQSPPRSTADRQ